MRPSVPPQLQPRDRSAHSHASGRQPSTIDSPTINHSVSLRLEMLQVARLAPKLLGDSVGLVREFLLRQQNPAGGFKDRTGASDLYYTVFGLEGLLALGVQGSRFEVQGSGFSSQDSTFNVQRSTFNVQQVPAWLERAEGYLRSLGNGKGLDFVHLCCLARGWADLGQASPSGSRGDCLDDLRPAILQRLEAFRTKDGGYHPIAGSEHGTVYGCFLAFGACQDLGVACPEPLRLAECLDGLKTEDGAWANDRALKVGSTNATAAAVALLRQLSLPVPPTAGNWLLARYHPQGGFLAAPNAPMPDLLTTATALHALAGLQVSFAHLKDSCLDFLDSLWTNEGGFHGHWADDHLDCEYTFYGLLALGHLSL